MNNPGWTDQKEVGNGFFLSLLTWTAFHLGRGPARVLLVFITAYFYLTGSHARRASHTYLRRVLKRNPRRSESYRHFYYFAAVSLDRLFLLAGRFNAFNVDMHGEQVFAELKQSQQGCLLFVTHVGSFDIMRVPGTREQSLPISILLDVNHNSMAMQLIQKLDPVLAGHIIDARQPRPELVLKLNEVVSNGGMVGIMVDRLHDRETGIECSLLDGKVHLPAGPWQMAAILRVPVILCFGLYHGGNRYSVHFEKLEQPAGHRRSERSSVITHQLQHYCERLEYYLRSEPYNWFNFYPFWNDETTGH